MKHYLSILLIAFAAASCDDSRIYEVNHDFDGRYWLADSIQNFRFEISDTVNSYNLYYNLRNSVSYPFRNIYVRYQLQDSSGNVLKTDLLNGQLFESKTGKPLGDGIGDIFDHQFPVIENYSFPKKGVYEVELNQYMRRDTLPEILAVGIRVEKATNE